MTTFFRGIESVIDELKEQRKQRENRLANDDKNRWRADKYLLMTKHHRDITQGEIYGINAAINILTAGVILPPEEYDQRFVDPDAPKVCICPTCESDDPTVMPGSAYCRECQDCEPVVLQ